MIINFYRIFREFNLCVLIFNLSLQIIVSEISPYSAVATNRMSMPCCVQLRHPAANCAAQAAVRDGRHVRSRQGPELAQVQGHHVLCGHGHRHGHGGLAVRVQIRRIQSGVPGRSDAATHLHVDSGRPSVRVPAGRAVDRRRPDQHHAAAVQASGGRAATDAGQVPLHFQYERPVAHIRGHAAD